MMHPVDARTLPIMTDSWWLDLTDMVVGCAAWPFYRQVYGNEMGFA
jgi:hypothetical protein